MKGYNCVASSHWCELYPIVFNNWWQVHCSSSSSNNSHLEKYNGLVENYITYHCRDSLTIAVQTNKLVESNKILVNYIVLSYSLEFLVLINSDWCKIFIQHLAASFNLCLASLDFRSFFLLPVAPDISPHQLPCFFFPTSFVRLRQEPRGVHAKRTSSQS